MLQALVSDLLELPDIEIIVLRDARLAKLAGVENLMIQSTADFEDAWIKALSSCDACWVIAPETGAALEQLCRQVEAAGVPLLNSSSESIALTASKSETADWLADNDIPTVNDSSLNGLIIERCVVKPDNAAGCENIHLFTHRKAAENWLSSRPEPQQWLLQPWLPGEHLSLSLLCKQGEAVVLSVNRQLFSELDGQLQLRGCVVNAEQPGKELEQLAARITAVIPGLWGYVGVDLIRTESGPVVIEINPRLTTSYVGLKQAMGINLAGMVLSLLKQPLPQSIPNSARSVQVDIADVC